MIDTHAHLYMCKQPLNVLIDNAKQAGLTRIINIGINLDTSIQALDQAKQFPDFISATIGIHPCDCKDFNAFETLKQLAQQHNFVAIGEIGLDYHHMTTSKKEQLHCFEAQLSIADELNLPVVIHNRKADDDIRTVIKQFPNVKKVLHCYSSSADYALSVINETTFFSFTGMITEAKKGKLINAIKTIPIDHIMIETDCPYLVPHEKKGQENEPAFVCLIARKISEIKEKNYKNISKTLLKTSKNFFNI